MAAVHTLYVHERPHVDDLALEWMIRQFGYTTEWLLGSHSRVRVRYSKNGEVATQEDQASPDKVGTITIVGLPGGRYYVQGSAKLETPTTILAEEMDLIREARREEIEHAPCMFWLNARGKESRAFIVKDPRLVHILSAVANDNAAGSHLYSFGKMTDTFHGILHNADLVRKMVFSVFQRIYSGDHDHSVLPTNEEQAQKAEALLSLVHHIAREKGFPEIAGTRIMKFLERRVEKPVFEPLNLIHCALILDKEESGKKKNEWVRVAIMADLKEQEHFHTITPAHANHAKFIPVTMKFCRIVKVKRQRSDGSIFEELREEWTDERRHIGIVQSDDPYIHRYLQWPDGPHRYDMALVIVQRSNGHVQLFPSARTVPVLNKKGEDTGRYKRYSLRDRMQAIAAHLRALECEKNSERIPPWDALSAADAPGKCTFFYHPPTGWVLSGSLTRSDAPATMLPLREITSAGILGFDDSKEVSQEMIGIMRTLNPRPIRR